MNLWLLEVFTLEPLEATPGVSHQGAAVGMALRRDPYPHPFRDPWEAVEVARHRVANDEAAVDYRIRNATTGKPWNRDLATRRREAERQANEMAEREGHRCHARGCEVQVRPALLMCPRHWKQVPRPLQQAVLQYYRAGQEIDKRPSREYLEAARAAVEAVGEA